MVITTNGLETFMEFDTIGTHRRGPERCRQAPLTVSLTQLHDKMMVSQLDSNPINMTFYTLSFKTRMSKNPPTKCPSNQMSPGALPFI